MFHSAIKSEFNVEPVASTRMDDAISRWMRIYRGAPSWVDEDNGIITINFAKAVCEETARLTTLAIGIKVSGSARADWLQKLVDDALYYDHRLRKWVEYGAAGGTVIFKPNGSGIDVITPDRFEITALDSNKKVIGIVFEDSYTEGDSYYTKHEYHRLRNMTDESGPVSRYIITNRTFKSSNPDLLGKEIPITETRWAALQPEAAIERNDRSGFERMLFGIFTMPSANNIDIDSPMGSAIFANAIKEMETLDIGYSRNRYEIDNSNTIELLSDMLISGKSDRLPSHVHKVTDANPDNPFYESVERKLNTTERKIGINQELSFIGYKCGYSNGYFVFDEKTGMVTATQVESDDRRTIQLIKDIRDNLQSALDDTIAAASVFADLYDLAPVGTYKVDYDFGDITYNEDEDRQRWYQLAKDGTIPMWMYLTRFEGFSEAEAKQLQAEREEKEAAQAKLFADME